MVRARTRPPEAPPPSLPLRLPPSLPLRLPLRLRLPLPPRLPLLPLPPLPLLLLLLLSLLPLLSLSPSLALCPLRAHPPRSPSYRYTSRVCGCLARRFEESVIFERRARACYVRVFGRRCWRKWSPLVQKGRAARDRFEKAARLKRRIGLAKAYRAWMAATERGHVEEKAARAERAMRQLAIARAFHSWFANIDTKAEQNAAKAIRAMRTLGLARALCLWRAQTNPHAKMVAAKAVRAMRQLGLAKVMRAWVAATDTKAEQNAAKAVRAMRQLGLAKAMRAWREASESACIRGLAMRALCALQQQGLARAMHAWMASTEHLTLVGKVMQRALARWRGDELRVGFRLWAAMRLATRAIATLWHTQRRGRLQRGFADLCAASGQLSHLQQVMAKCMRAWTRQSLHMGFVKLRDLCSSEAVLVERVGRIMMGIQRQALSFGFGELNAHRLERRLAETRLGSVYGFGRLGAFRRAWSAIEVASGMTQLAIQRGRSALILLRRLQLDDAWLHWSRLRLRRGRTRKLRQQSNYLYAMHKIPSMLALWRRRAHERRLLWLGLTSHKVVQLTEAFGRIKQCATCRVNVARALQLALAFLRGSTHASALHRWRWHRACKLEVHRLREVATRYCERSLLRRVMFVLHCMGNVCFGVAVAAEQTVQKVRVRHLAWAFARARAHQRARHWSAETSTTCVSTTLRFALHRWSGLAIKVKRVKAEKKALRAAEAEAREEAARVERARQEAEAKQARREATEDPCLACMCSPRRPLFPTGATRSGRGGDARGQGGGGAQASAGGGGKPSARRGSRGRCKGSRGGARGGGMGGGGAAEARR